ncbi:Uu.00g033530.m01.CDS01 [Anthostomella pinea]|uniref:Uu.00g033530.m01.CDS01 n=1 Tax=Anthostomella pinea TaxID=933095 RepID=A0AAI8V9W2_9PEZI|nr:Uu.00g033530.m01.CDS01 [Anthostomella pinea]
MGRELIDMMKEMMIKRREHSVQECPHPSRPIPTTTIDPEGDMFIHVGRNRCLEPNFSKHRHEDAMRLRIDGKLVGQASPSWLGMLAKSNENSDMHGQWEIHVPEDNAPAMLTIFNILYSKFDQPPLGCDTDIDELYNITVLTEKYNLTHLLRPWAAQWVLSMEKYWLGRTFGAGESTYDLEKLIWIFWVLGHQPLYSFMVLQVAAYSSLDKHGNLIDPSKHVCFVSDEQNFRHPSHAMDAIKFARVSMLRSITSSIKSTIQEHLHGTEKPSWLQCAPSKSDKKSDNTDDHASRSTTRTAFISFLQSEKLWPTPDAFDISRSPMALLADFKQPGASSLAAFAHAADGRCRPDGVFHARVARIIRETTLPLVESSKAHLRAQAAKTGLRLYDRMGYAPPAESWSMQLVVSSLDLGGGRQSRRVVSV